MGDPALDALPHDQMSSSKYMVSTYSNTIRVMRNGCLAYYRAEADAAFWDQHWREKLTSTYYVNATAGRLGRFESLFTRWLPRQGRILEAGCGTGYWVAALRARGYDAEGVEWGGQTVAAIRRILPELPVQTGDVTDLDEPDGAFAGYISLGVMEHREAGPQPFLREAWRLLEPGGLALISVPNLHPLRRLKGRLGLYRGSDKRLPFYQYAYPVQLFRRLAEEAGFVIREMVAYDGFKGLKDELPFSRVLLQCLNKTRLTKPWLERCRFGHMMMYVCEKRGDAV